ncbi:hypothetical protein ACP4OV_006961 [Aristida adscensionis]
MAALAALVHGEPHDVACVVVDGQWYTMLGTARRAGVPPLALRADGATTFLSMLLTPSCAPPATSPSKMLEEPVPGLEPLRVRDLIRVRGSDEETVLRFIDLVAGAMRASAASVVVNTFDAVEAPELAKIEGELSGRPAFAVGLLHLLCPAAMDHGVHAPDRGCAAWLDAHPPCSVFYVSLGSMWRVDRAEFEEMAHGLARSGVPFLWSSAPASSVAPTRRRH